MPYRDSFCLWIGGNADANFHNVCWLWFCLWLEVKYKATKILLGRKMVQKLSLWISEWLEVFNSTLSSPLGLDGRIYQTSRGCRVRKCIYVKLLCVSLTDIFYEMEMCCHRLQGNTRNGWISEKKSSRAFSHESRSFSYCFHLISNWCLHYWAVLSAHIEHHATLCCRRAICRRLGSGSSFYRYFPRFTLTLDSYQTDRVVIHQPGLGLMRRIPSTRSAIAALHSELHYFSFARLKETEPERLWRVLEKLCVTSKRTRKTCGRTMWDSSWQETKKLIFTTSSTYSNFFTSLPTRMTHPVFMSCPCCLFPGWNLWWHHCQSH